ncbi:hypothetical protein [Methylocystis suflitae]|uniref:hypothetical protein n=1 Tax=Methylocystis suflitae TaxID=2951405 RepID=UPI00210E175B|nr:hypothetical protein [Methylocystis suflitae]MCQ4189859.1 hypothetical protein [Methylocystis suflitae]
MKEAIGLFRAFRDLHPEKYHERLPRCLYAARWRSGSIPEGYSRKYFGIRALAGLTAEYPSGFHEVEKIFDPESQHPDAFCTEEELQEHLNAVRDILKDENKLADKRLVRESSLVGEYSTYPVLHKEHTFPVFDTKFRKAAFLVYISESYFRRSKDGGIGRGAPEFLYAVVIFEKRNGVWREIETSVLGQT